MPAEKKKGTMVSPGAGQLAIIKQNNKTNSKEDIDGSFESVLREKSRQRKEREDAAVASLRVQVNHLEAALQAETKRRIAVTLELQERATSEIQKLEERMKESLREQQEQSNARFEALEARLSAVEGAWRKDHLALEKEIQKESKETRERMRKVQQQTDAEHTARKAREEGLAQQLHDLSEQYRRTWETEREERTAALQGLQERLDQQNHQRTLLVSSYTDDLQFELQALRSELAQEEEDRKQKDDEIVGALNRYIEQFQKSLAIL